MRATYQGKRGLYPGQVSIFRTSDHYKPDRTIDTIPKLQVAVVRSLNRNRGDYPKVKLPEPHAYAINGTLAVAVDGSYTIRDGYHRIREATETWLKCGNILLNKDRLVPAVDLHEARKDAADAALAGYDFEPNMVTDTDAWNEDGDEWTCVLSMDDHDHKPYACGFIVRFKPGTAEVTEAYPGDPH